MTAVSLALHMTLPFAEPFGQYGEEATIIGSAAALASDDE
jgi:hypothetical protein